MKKMHIKYFLLILLINVSYTSAFGQITDKDIIGRWQWQSAEVGAGYIESYIFYQDGTFIFSTNEFDGTRRILSFGGTYHLKDNVLCLQIKQSKEIEGGTIERDEIVGGSGWIINNGKIVNKKYKHPSICNLKLERKNICILIDEQEFYKVEAH